MKKYTEYIKVSCKNYVRDCKLGSKIVEDTTTTRTTFTPLIDRDARGEDKNLKVKQGRTQLPPCQVVRGGECNFVAFFKTELSSSNGVSVRITIAYFSCQQQQQKLEEMVVSTVWCMLWSH